MTRTKDPAAEICALKYEDALAELERIVQTMESGQLALEDSLAAYSRGALLLKHCQKQLADAEERLRVVDGDALKALSLDAGDAS